MKSRSKSHLKHFFEGKGIIFVCVICFFLIIPLDIFLFNLLYHFLPIINGKVTIITELYDISLVVFTFILICVSWIQLSNLYNISTEDFLLRIDDRYGSESIIKARAIIHKIICKTRQENSEINIEKIQDEIEAIEENEEKAEDFMYLLNFLDFLETIAYFGNKEFISIIDIKELLGDSLLHYYGVFERLIKNREENYGHHDELKELVEKIKIEKGSNKQ